MEKKQMVNRINEILSSNNSINNSHVDPWHSISSIDDSDHVILVEFSEIEGPRQALSIPDYQPYLISDNSSSNNNDNSTSASHRSNALSAHFDRNEFAVWLMTTDYQASNQRDMESNFGSENDVHVILSNEEQGLHVFTQHFTLFDLEARGFLRPFCLCYASSCVEKLYDNFDQLRTSFRQLLGPVKLCNKIQFGRELDDAINLLETTQNQTVNSYYELTYTSNAESASNSETEQRFFSPNLHNNEHDELLKKIDLEKRLNSQCRTMQSELEDIKSVLETSSFGSAKCHQNHQKPNIERWIIKSRLFGSKNAVEMSDNENFHLKTFRNLCPCVFPAFEQSLNEIWRLFNGIDRYSDQGKVGDVYFKFGHLPALNFNKCLNSIPDRVVKSSQIANFGRFRDDASLLSFGPNIKHVIYPLLLDQFMLICGSEFKKHLVEKYVRTLAAFVPNYNSVEKYISEWNNQVNIKPSHFTDYKIFGQSVDFNSKIDEILPPHINIKPFIAILNWNDKTFESLPYEGGHLDILSSRNLLKRHKLDSTFVPYVLQLLICKFVPAAYILYYHIYGVDGLYSTKNVECRSNGSKKMDNPATTDLFIRLHKFADQFKLSGNDMQISKHFVEWFKYINAGAECPPTITTAGKSCVINKWKF